MRLRFWGVRGSSPTPEMEKLAYGGNTSCIEVRGPNNEVLIFDGGTGIRRLGASLLHEFHGAALRINFFSTHLHWDHIQGIPFFAPLYLPNTEMIFHSVNENLLKRALARQMAEPYFPVDFESLPLKKSFVLLGSAPVPCGDLTVQAFPVNHPQGAVGYRVECGGAVIVYPGDLEHGHSSLDSVVRDYAQNADILIYDAQYTPEEYPDHTGWGHSTWEQGAKVAHDAKVKQLILFHYDPSHDDQFLDAMIGEASQAFGNIAGAKEGLEISL